jgi:hypothetical protein
MEIGDMYGYMQMVGNFPSHDIIENLKILTNNIIDKEDILARLIVYVGTHMCN